MPRVIRRSLLTLVILTLSSLVYFQILQVGLEGEEPNGTIWFIILSSAFLLSILERSAWWGCIFGTAFIYGTFPATFILNRIDVGEILSIGLGGPFLSFIIFGSAAVLSKRVYLKLSEAKREREEKARIERETARLKREENEITNLINQTQNIIEKAISNATNNEEPLWLSGLLILREDSYFLQKEFENGGASYLESKAKLLDLKEKAEVLSSPPPKEEMVKDTVAERDYYQVLGIMRNASTGQIKDIYRKLVFIYHPDTGKSLGVDGDQRFREIQQAYETLSDPVKRREYNKKLGV